MSSPYRRDYEVDILIRGWNNVDLTRRCIESIVEHTNMDRVHITYVDNGSSRVDARELMPLDAPRYMTHVFLPFNHGSVRAINIGLALATMSSAPYVLLLDNDTEIPDGDIGWLDRWLASFEDEFVGAAGAVSDYTSGLQHAEANPDLYQKDWQQEDGQQGFKEPPAIPLLVSFAMMLRKKAIMQVGLFDEQFEPGNCEDYDYSIRLNDAGWKCVIASSVWIHHKGSQTFGKMGFSELLETNFGKLIAKYGKDGLARRGIKIE